MSTRKKNGNASQPLGDLPLSARALRWLASKGVRRVGPPCSEEETRALLARRGAPSWPVLVAVETTFGGLSGETPDGREIWFGALGRTWFGRTQKRRPLVAVGCYSPIVWYMDEGGRVLEFDELGEGFYESDSIAHRIEELAIHRTSGVSFAGQHGERFAELLGLSEVAEVRDSMTRAWGEAAHDHAKGMLVTECFTPSDYGKKDRIWSTWVAAKEPAVRRLETATGLTRNAR